MNGPHPIPETPVEALSHLREFTFFHAARYDYLRELCENVTGKPFHGDRSELESICQELKGNEALWKELVATKGIDELSRQIVKVVLALGDSRQRMAKAIMAEDGDADETEVQETIMRLDKHLFDLVRRRNWVIGKAAELGITTEATPIEEDCNPHKLRKTIMARLRSEGCV